jgi:hypothetical protein
MTDDVGGGGRVHIQTDRAGIFRRAAAYVQNAWQVASCVKWFETQAFGIVVSKTLRAKENSTGPRLQACAI